MNKYIDLSCAVCGNIFHRLLKNFKYESKRSGPNYSPLCSLECIKKFRSKKQIVNCNNCGVSFEKKFSQIVKTDNNYCSRSCAAITNNKKISRVNLSNRIACCVLCRCEVEVKSNTPNKNVVCKSCKLKQPIKYRNTLVYCTRCYILISNIWTARKYCSDCRAIVQKENGLKSVAAQSKLRRSKNEIYFADLCIKEFQSVSTNDAIFVNKYGNWDADVIIHDYKIAVLWNGIWHYRQVRRNHSVKQVQARDKIKINTIKNNGYIPYVIADYGKENKLFVEKEFEKFKVFLNAA